MDDVYWNLLGRLIGTWEGEVTGKAGKGKGKTTYEHVLQSKYIYFYNRAEFTPQKANPDGEIHEDMGYFSYDKFTEKGHLRVFYSEGYVSTYQLIDVNTAKKSVTFEAEEHENLPPGFRAKITFYLEKKGIFIEKFELASPGKEYGMCIENQWFLV